MWTEPKTDWMDGYVYDVCSNLNRVEDNIAEVNSAALALGYITVQVHKFGRWTMNDELTADEYNRVVDNLLDLEKVLAVPDDLPPLYHKGDTDWFYAEDANQIEAHTLALKRAADGTAQLVIPCGTMHSGGRPLLPR